MKVFMRPKGDSASGVGTVIRNYKKIFPEHGIEFVDDYHHADVMAIHIEAHPYESHMPSIAINHGLYWTKDYEANRYEWTANVRVVDSIRHADCVTVPSKWVARAFERDMRFSPYILPHGVVVEEWNVGDDQNFVLAFAKNRVGDVCDPSFLGDLAVQFPNILFLSTFPFDNMPNNVKVIGVKSHEDMKRVIEAATVVMSPIKETFGILTLEAMAAGKPIVGPRHGGNVDLIQHGVNGYLSKVGNTDDLAEGLAYCIKHKNQLGENSRTIAADYDWHRVADKFIEVCNIAIEKHNQPADVSVVIPCYNYASKLGRAVESVTKQTYPAKEIIIVDDQSKDNTEEVAKDLALTYPNVVYIKNEKNSGVAYSRNNGILHASSKYIACLDADDEIAPKFLEACVPIMESDKSIGISYTKITAIAEDGREAVPKWPGEFDATQHLTARNHDNLRGRNQLPTCCVFRKEAFDRSGGYDPKYCPLGAGAEDAELWARIFEMGYSAKLATDAPLFRYHSGGLISTAHNKKTKHPNLVEPHWLENKPYSIDKMFPFACQADPANGISHPVQQYDEPLISVIIPVGKEHESISRNAINSVVGQFFRNWELIIVWDTDEELPHWMSSYPFAEKIITGGKGVAHARNRGAEAATSPFLVFLDADDELDMSYLGDTLDAFIETPGIVYTDYFQRLFIDESEFDNFPRAKIERYIPDNGELWLKTYAAEYDCARAQRQPDKHDLYHWSLITCLIPKAWHFAVGGFDETMETFEDVLYHYKLARAGYCYVHLEEFYVAYNLHTGKRRLKGSLDTDKGREVGVSMLKYMQSVLEKEEIMPCSKCPKSSRKAPSYPEYIQNIHTSAPVELESDEEYQMIRYNPRNKGDQRVMGSAPPIRNYSYHAPGDVFLVHIDDIKLQPTVFVPIKTRLDNIEEDVIMETEQQPQSLPAPPVLGTLFDIRSLPGITENIAKQMEDAGITNKDDIIALGVDGLQKFRGIAETRAEALVAYLSQ